MTGPWTLVPGSDGLTRSDEFRAITHVIDGVAVVRCRGRLDAAALRPCEFALAAAVEADSPWVIADLGQAEVGPESVAVLSLMRRYVTRHGALLVLAALSPEGLRALEQARVSDLYPIMPTVAIAADVAGAYLPGGLAAGRAGGTGKPRSWQGGRPDRGPAPVQA